MSTSSEPHHPVEIDAAPVGEHIHMPGPSLLPLLNCVGLAVTIIGVTEGLVFLVAGLSLFLSTTVIWAIKAAQETAELPDEHH
jgi:hypothetical protein